MDLKTWQRLIKILNGKIALHTFTETDQQGAKQQQEKKIIFTN